MLTPIYLTTNPSVECPQAGHPLFEKLLQNFSLYTPGWDSFQGIHLLWLALPGEATKLFFFYFTQSSVSKNYFACQGTKSGFGFMSKLNPPKSICVTVALVLPRMEPS